MATILNELTDISKSGNSGIASQIFDIKEIVGKPIDGQYHV